MKKKILGFSILVASMIGFGLYSCNKPDHEAAGVNVSKENAVEVEGVHVYYFHSTRRCPTCQAIESVTKEAISEYFNDNVPFESINREENKDNPLVKKYEISGQTLLVVNGDKVTDLTNDAFLLARLKPGEFKSLVRSTIETMQ